MEMAIKELLRHWNITRRGDECLSPAFDLMGTFYIAVERKPPLDQQIAEPGSIAYHFCH
jgi:hypothetical protein